MGRSLRGRLRVPGDKSISHRALMMAALSKGQCSIENLAQSLDVESTGKCLARLGVKVEREGSAAGVSGVGFKNFMAPADPLDCGNSGTTLRLLLGLLAGSNINAVLDGDSSLRKRPMMRVIEPLRKMGARIEHLPAGDGCPLEVRGTSLKGIAQKLIVPSAQVKSAVLLAGLFADGETVVEECALTRDHTEKLLDYLGADIRVKGREIRLKPPGGLRAFDMIIPGDPSSAAFPIVAAVLLPGSELGMENVLLNASRLGFVDVLKRMGADISFENEREEKNEPIGDILVRSSKLSPADESRHQVPTYIDEVPILALAASQAPGKSVFRGLGELRVKESDRLTGIVTILNKMGGKAGIVGDDLFIEGPAKLAFYLGECFGDHRLAMMIETANLVCHGRMAHGYDDVVGVSFNNFYSAMKEVLK